MTKRKKNQEIEAEEPTIEGIKAAAPFSLEELRADIAARELIDYELLPYIDLYMDQIITLMSEQNKDERHRVPPVSYTHLELRLFCCSSQRFPGNYIFLPD